MAGLILVCSAQSDSAGFKEAAITTGKNIANGFYTYTGAKFINKKVQAGYQKLTGTKKKVPIAYGEFISREQEGPAEPIDPKKSSSGGYHKNGTQVGGIFYKDPGVSTDRESWKQSMQSKEMEFNPDLPSYRKNNNIKK